jgi:hypothetical protein
MPHLSFIRRKPKPLGAEFKSVCDEGAGIAMFLPLWQKSNQDRKAFEKKITHLNALPLSLFFSLQTCPCQNNVAVLFLQWAPIPSRSSGLKPFGRRPF